MKNLILFFLTSLTLFQSCYCVDAEIVYFKDGKVHIYHEGRHYIGTIKSSGFRELEIPSDINNEPLSHMIHDNKNYEKDYKSYVLRQKILFIEKIKP